MVGNARIVIIGAGPAGCAAAVQCKRLGESPILLDRSGKAGGLLANAFCIENYPGLEPMDGKSFVRLLEKHIERFGIGVELGHVHSISKTREGFSITGNFGEIRSLAVIAAVGTDPSLLPVPDADDLAGHGLYYDICSAPPGIKTAIVAGSGEAALDYSLSLAKLGATVEILVRGDRLKACGRLVDLVNSNPSIKVSFGVEIKAIFKTAGIVQIHLKNRGDTTLPTVMAADALVAAIGRKSAALKILKGLDEDLPRTLSTRSPGLFIAGDARTASLGQVGMAVGDGLAAALAAVKYLE